MSRLNSILIVALIVALIFSYFGGCNSSNSIFKLKNKFKGEVITTVTTIDTFYHTDTVSVPEISYVPKITFRDTGRLDTITEPIDTLSILKDFYAKNIYLDTIQIDTNGFIFIVDTIYKNTLAGRGIDGWFTCNSKTIVKNTDNWINKRIVYGGGGFSGNGRQINYIGGELMLKDKKNHLYGVGLGLNQNLQPVVSGRLLFKIGK